MKNYPELKKIKSKELNLLENRIKSLINDNKTDLNEYFETFLFNGAKRLRPLFIFLICDLLNLEIDNEIIDLAVSIELLHSASLIHDDIIDNGILRRNTPCLHKKYNDKIAVLAGDYLLSLATKIINPKILTNLSNAVTIMTKAEINNLLKRFENPALDDYIKYSKEKTAALFCAGVKSIFILKNINENKDIINFTEQFALCFQIKDDINNYLKNDKCKLSKDIETGIYTLPYILKQKNLEYDIINTCKGFLKNEIIKANKNLDVFSNSNTKTYLLTLSNLLDEGTNDR